MVTNKNAPLVIICFDAADHRLAQKWAGEGHMPTVAGMMGRGCWGTVGGPEQVCEHGSSLSLLSGVSRAEHGYYHFRQLAPGTYDLRPFTHRDTLARPFWSHLRESGRRVAAIDAPDCEPVPGLEGAQLANWAVHAAANSVLPPCAEPPALLRAAHSAFGPQIPVLEFAPGSSFADDLEMYHRLLERVRRKGALCRELLGRDGAFFDLIVIGFFESHTAGHRFWKYRPEAPGYGAENELTHAIREVYRAVDREVGLLLDALPRDANVFIFSSFGMDDNYPTAGLIEDFCRRLGYQTPAGHGGGSSSTGRKGLRALLPESWRAAAAARLPTKAQERLLAESFRAGTDWSKTTAFAVPALYTGFIRVNLCGREPEGTIEPGAEYDMLMERLTDDLGQLVDPLTGRPAVRRVTRADRNFGGGTPLSLPDLFIDWEPRTHFMERVLHPRAELTQRRLRYHRDSYHSADGFIAAAGPAVHARGHAGEISSLDLAPTFLSLLGVPVPCALKGTPLGIAPGAARAARHCAS